MAPAKNRGEGFRGVERTARDVKRWRGSHHWFAVGTEADVGSADLPLPVRPARFAQLLPGLRRKRLTRPFAGQDASRSGRTSR